MSKARSDGAWSNLQGNKQPVLGRVWNVMILKIPSIPNHSTIPDTSSALSKERNINKYLLGHSRPPQLEASFRHPRCWEHIPTSLGGQACSTGSQGIKPSLLDSVCSNPTATAAARSDQTVPCLLPSTEILFSSTPPAPGREIVWEGEVLEHVEWFYPELLGECCESQAIQHSSSSTSSCRSPEPQTQPSHCSSFYPLSLQRSQRNICRIP